MFLKLYLLNHYSKYKVKTNDLGFYKKNNNMSLKKKYFLTFFVPRNK